MVNEKINKKNQEQCQKFRCFFTSSKKMVIAGKNAKNNEEVIEQAEKNEQVLHTAKPGSPFVNIKSKKANKTDIKQAAVFCALKSQDWRDNKSDVEVHIFKAQDVYKTKLMKTGTFGVKNFKIIKVKKQDILKLEKKLKGGKIKSN